MLAGDVDTVKALLRDSIKATVGFEQLGRSPSRASTVARFIWVIAQFSGSCCRVKPTCTVV
jgi:hypothetical protein